MRKVCVSSVPAAALSAWLIMALALGCASAAVPDAPGRATSGASGGLAAPDGGTEPPPPRSDEQAPEGVPGKPTQCPKLESVLYQLSLAPDPAGFAQQHGLDYAGGLVRVVIDLNQPDAPLPEGFQLQIERRVAHQVRVRAPLDSLCALSEQGVVNFVHVPMTPGPLGPGQ